MMPEMKRRTKIPRDEYIGDSLEGELATYEQVGLFQRSVSKRILSTATVALCCATR